MLNFHWLVSVFNNIDMLCSVCLVFIYLLCGLFDIEKTNQILSLILLSSYFKLDTHGEQQHGITVTMCYVQLDPDDAKNLWAMVMYNGGQCQMKLDNTVTHLVTTSTCSVSQRFNLDGTSFILRMHVFLTLNLCILV